MRRFSFPAFLLVVALLFQTASAGASFAAMSAGTSGAPVENCVRGDADHKSDGGSGSQHAGHNCLACQTCAAAFLLSPRPGAAFFGPARHANRVGVSFDASQGLVASTARAHRARAPPSFLL
jgi:hypothetical protein